MSLLGGKNRIYSYKYLDNLFASFKSSSLQVHCRQPAKVHTAPTRDLLAKETRWDTKSTSVQKPQKNTNHCPPPPKANLHWPHPSPNASAHWRWTENHPNRGNRCQQGKGRPSFSPTYMHFLIPTSDLSHKTKCQKNPKDHKVQSKSPNRIYAKT